MRSAELSHNYFTRKHYSMDPLTHEKRSIRRAKEFWSSAEIEHTQQFSGPNCPDGKGSVQGKGVLSEWWMGLGQEWVVARGQKVKERGGCLKGASYRPNQVEEVQEVQFSSLQFSSSSRVLQAVRA